jgi:hypothetical protein
MERRIGMTIFSRILLRFEKKTANSLSLSEVMHKFCVSIIANC